MKRLLHKFDYADDLGCIVVQPPVPTAAVAITGRTELQGRIRAIGDEKATCRTIATSLTMLALVTGLTSTIARAMPDAIAASSPSFQPANPSPTAPQAFQPSAPKVNVLCVDAQGKPVPNAEVFLFQQPAGDKTPYVRSGPFTTDEQGRAFCSDAIFSNEFGNFDRWIYARVPGRLIGTARGASGRTALHSTRKAA